MERAPRRRKPKPDAEGTARKASVPADACAPPAQRRLAAVDRRREILAKSIEYFAQVGFDGGTRELARHLGTTQPLLYRYFPNKDALIQEIYKAVYLDQWKPAWDGLLTDPSRPLRARLQDFYEAYTDTILNPQWIRIYFFAGLKGVSINERYLALVEERILARIIREFHREHGLPQPAAIAPEDMELAWHLQGGIFYYGVRKYVYRTPLHLPKTEMISTVLDVFFAGYGAVLERRRVALPPEPAGRQAPVKAVNMDGPRPKAATTKAWDAKRPARQAPASKAQAGKTQAGKTPGTRAPSTTSTAPKAVRRRAATTGGEGSAATPAAPASLAPASPTKRPVRKRTS